MAVGVLVNSTSLIVSFGAVFRSYPTNFKTPTYTLSFTTISFVIAIKSDYVGSCIEHCTNSLLLVYVLSMVIAIFDRPA